jgi:alpha-galactosidase
MTLWSILAAPLLIGCDLTRLDRFTFDLLTNEEVLDVNQDPLGRQGWRISKDAGREVWARPLYDRSWAVGLFNLGWEHAEVRVSLRSLGISGARTVRDLWRKKDLGTHRNSFCAKVPPHGAVLVRIGDCLPHTI